MYSQQVNIVLMGILGITCYNTVIVVILLIQEVSLKLLFRWKSSKYIQVNTIKYW